MLRSTSNRILFPELCVRVYKTMTLSLCSKSSTRLQMARILLHFKSRFFLNYLFWVASNCGQQIFFLLSHSSLFVIMWKLNGGILLQGAGKLLIGCCLTYKYHKYFIYAFFPHLFTCCIRSSFFCWFAVPEGAFAFIHVQLTVFYFHSTVLECLNIDNCCVPFFSSFCWMQRYCCMRLCFNSLILFAHPLNNVGTQTLWKKSANMAIILCYCTWNRRWNRIVRERKKDQNVINRLQLNCCLLCCAIKCVCAIRAHSSIECILITSFELISFFTACFVFFFMFGFHFFLSGLLLLLLFSCCHQ